MRKLLLLFFAFSFFLGSVCHAADVTGEYYYGAECGWCKELEPWLNEKTNILGVQVRKHEIWHNKEEAQGYNQMMNLYGVSQDDRGTPTLILNNKVFIGAEEIKKNFEAEVNNARRSLVKQNQQPQQPPKPQPAAEMKAPDMWAVFLAAAADSVNPCAMMVLLILLASLMVYQKDNMVRVVASTTAFIFAVFVTYFALGLGITNMLAALDMSKAIASVVGAVAILIGLWNLKDAFFSKNGQLSSGIPTSWRESLTTVLAKATSPLGAFAAGVVVTMFELPCTGGPYLFGLSLISVTDSIATRMMYLLFYNIVFISPLIALAIACIRGLVTIERAESFGSNHAKAMKFFTGAVMLAGGIWLVWFR